MPQSFPTILKFLFFLIQYLLDYYKSLINFQSSDRIDLDNFCFFFDVSLEGQARGVIYYTIFADIVSTIGFIFFKCFKKSKEYYFMAYENGMKFKFQWPSIFVGR